MDQSGYGNKGILFMSWPKREPCKDSSDLYCVFDINLYLGEQRPVIQGPYKYTYAHSL